MKFQILNSVKKILTISIIVFLNWYGFSAVAQTFAYFNDTEISIDNAFSAGTLDFSVSATSDFSPEVVFNPSQSAIKEILVNNNGTLGFSYRVKADNFISTGSSDLCDDLNLTASLGSDVMYDNEPLKDFDISAGNYTNPADWNFVISMDAYHTGQACSFDFIFDGVQIGGTGFSDQEIISNTVIDGEEIPVPVVEISAPAESSEPEATDDAIVEDPVIDDSQAIDETNEVQPIEEDQPAEENVPLVLIGQQDSQSDQGEILPVTTNDEPIVLPDNSSGGETETVEI
jgi:hypothetical protein